MHQLAERLLRIVRKQEFIRAGDRVAVAVSGGADSVALLLLLIELRSELGIVLSVAHVNHKLRGAESDKDEEFVTKLAAKQGLELETRTAPVEQGAGIESAARRLRYEYFQELASAGRATRIATAHTLDDQAETVLLRMCRGAGIRGLAGILPRLKLESEGRACGEVVRPLLAFRRSELLEYLRARGQDWREDSSNQDLTFLRNRARQRLMPVITEEFGEAAIEHMAELAEIARAEEEHWTKLGPAHSSLVADPTLHVEQLLGLPLAAARRTVRAWIERNAPEAAISFRLIEEILDLARGTVGRTLELSGQPAGANDGPLSARPKLSPPSTARPRVVRRGRDELVLETPSDNARDYEYVLAVPGEVSVPELRVRIMAETVDVTKVPEQHRQELLDPAQLESKVVIRNWRAGDRYWPAHSKQEKKVKELLADRHATGKEKKLWPVALCRGELIWMRGFAVPKAWRARSGKALWIREVTDQAEA
jgi:tRNA(Ile)-lysidine synthase